MGKVVTITSVVDLKDSLTMAGEVLGDEVKIELGNWVVKATPLMSFDETIDSNSINFINVFEHIIESADLMPIYIDDTRDIIRECMIAKCLVTDISIIGVV